MNIQISYKKTSNSMPKKITKKVKHVRPNTKNVPSCTKKSIKNKMKFHSNNSDAIRSFMENIANIELIEKDDEVRISNFIKEGVFDSLKLIFSFKNSINHFLHIAKDLEQNIILSKSLFSLSKYSNTTLSEEERNKLDDEDSANEENEGSNEKTIINKVKKKKNIFYNIHVLISEHIKPVINLIQSKVLLFKEKFVNKTDLENNIKLGEEIGGIFIKKFFLNRKLVQNFTIFLENEIKKHKDSNDEMFVSAFGYPKEKVNAILNKIKYFNQKVQFHKKQMTLANLRLVISVAKRYFTKNLHFMDLVQSGSKGLMNAIEKFDAGKGNKFSTYAVWWVRQSITRDIAERGCIVRLPVHMKELILKVIRTYNALSNKKNKLEITFQDIAKILKIPVLKVKRAFMANKTIINLDSCLSHQSEDHKIIDFVSDSPTRSPSEYVKRENMTNIVNNLIETLNSREKKIIQERFGLNGGTALTLEQIGTKLCSAVTRERVRQLVKTAFNKIRCSDTAKEIMYYLSEHLN